MGQDEGECPECSGYVSVSQLGALIWSMQQQKIKETTQDPLEMMLPN